MLRNSEYADSPSLRFCTRVYPTNQLPPAPPCFYPTSGHLVHVVLHETNGGCQMADCNCLFFLLPPFTHDGSSFSGWMVGWLDGWLVGWTDRLFFRCTSQLVSLATYPISLSLFPSLIFCLFSVLKHVSIDPAFHILRTAVPYAHPPHSPTRPHFCPKLRSMANPWASETLFVRFQGFERSSTPH